MTELHALSTKLISCDSVDEAIGAILDAAISLHDAQFGNVQLYRPETETLEIVAQRGFSDEFLEFFRSVSTDDPCSCGRALRAKTTVSVNDVTRDAEYAPFVEIALKAGYRAVQSTPMISSDGDVIGVVSTHFRETRTLSAATAHVTTLFAQQAADMIVQLRDAEESFTRQKLLAGELSHRVKNVLMMVLAVSRKTRKEVTNLDEYEDAFEDRMGALAHAHDALRDSDWKTADLRSLLREQLTAFNSDQVSLSGPDIALRPDAVYVLALVLHELGVNACKHGALRTQRGRVSIDWEHDVDDDTLTISWRERGGPKVVAPTDFGFGGALLRNLVDSKLIACAFEYDPRGVNCTLHVPGAVAAMHCTAAG